jgi:2Fe-2S ferredoxin
LAEAGSSVMITALAAGIEEILAECGGNCMCATCHVYLEPALLAAVPPPGADELGLLEGTAAERRPNSRLSCQVTVQDGMVVVLPDRQL